MYDGVSDPALLTARFTHPVIGQESEGDGQCLLATGLYPVRVCIPDSDLGVRSVRPATRGPLSEGATQ